MHRRRSSERGEGQMGCLMGVILMLAAVFVAYKLVPVKVRAAEMKQVVSDMSKMAGQYDNARILKGILEIAQKENLPITEDDVKIDRRNNNSMIHIEVAYSVPVEFPGFTYNWNFRHKAENPIF